MFIQPLMKSMIDNINNANVLINQILIIANQKGLLNDYLKRGKHNKNSIKKMWKELSEVEDIRIGFSKVITLVTYDDAILLTSSILSKWPSFLAKK